MVNYKVMRKELKEQSRLAKQEHEESEKRSRAEQARNETIDHKFRSAVYSRLELKEAEVAALEWFYERPDLLDNYLEFYSVLPKAYPIANQFIQTLRYSRPDRHAEHDAVIADWIKEVAFPGEGFDDFLDELPSLCKYHKLWQDRFKIRYELEEQRRRKRDRFWLSILAIAILLILIITISN